MQRERALPQEDRRNDVPFVHGHPRRAGHHEGEGEHAQVGDRRHAPTRGTDRRAHEGGDGPLRRLQGVQDGMPLRRGRGLHEDRGPLPDGQGTRLQPAPEGGRAHPPPTRARGLDALSLQRRRRYAPRPQGRRPRRDRPPPLVAARDEQNLLQALPEAAAGHRPGRGCPLQRHLERVPAARGRGGRREALRRRGREGAPAEGGLLRQAHALRGARRRGAGRTRSATWTC